MRPIPVFNKTTATPHPTAAGNERASLAATIAQLQERLDVPRDLRLREEEIGKVNLKILVKWRGTLKHLADHVPDAGNKVRAHVQAQLEKAAGETKGTP